MQHHRVRVVRQKRRRPGVKLPRAKRNAEHEIATDAQPTEVVVDQTHHAFGVRVAQDWIRGPTLERSAVQRPEHGFLLSGESDSFGGHDDLPGRLAIGPVVSACYPLDQVNEIVSSRQIKRLQCRVGCAARGGERIPAS